MSRPSEDSEDRLRTRLVEQASGIQPRGSLLAVFLSRPSAVHLISGAMMSMTTLATTPAHAFELFGLKFFEPKQIQSETVPDPLAYETALQVDGGAANLKGTLEATSLLVSRSDQFPSGQSGLISRSLGDVERLVGRLYANGFYGGTVDIALNGTPLQTTLETGQIPGPRPVSVVIRVMPGPQFTFGRVEIGLSDGGEGLADDPSFWGLSPGEQADSGKILASESRIVQMLRQRGYPKARIGERVIVADHATNKLDVRLQIVSGPRARFGAVSVSGTEITEPEFVVRQAMLPEGEVYSPEELEKARKRLNDIGIFSSVRLVEGDISHADGLMPITIEVSERKRHVIGAGASWSSTEGFGVEAYWRRRNLFGRGELLSIEGSVGRIGNSDLRDMEYSTRVVFEKPGAFGPLTKFTTSLGAKQETPDAYTSRTLTLDAYVARQFTEKLTARAGAELFYADEEDAFGEADYLIVGLPVDLTYDSRDNKLDPSSGIYAAAMFEPAYDTLNSTGMVFAKATASSYLALDEAKRFVLAGRVSAGSILAPSVDNVPASRRLIAGGGGSIRGYGYRNVGPRVNGDVVGGRSQLEFSGEVRIKATETIGIVAFVDGGNAFEGSVPDLSEPIKIGVGAGVRYYTPIGPLRIDAALPLDPGKDDPDFALYVGLSQAF